MVTLAGTDSRPAFPRGRNLGAIAKCEVDRKSRRGLFRAVTSGPCAHLFRDCYGVLLLLDQAMEEPAKERR
jgi:hypothetical protein